jgi:hypothetical protein
LKQRALFDYAAFVNLNKALTWKVQFHILVSDSRAIGYVTGNRCLVRPYKSPSTVFDPTVFMTIGTRNIKDEGVDDLDAADVAEAAVDAEAFDVAEDNMFDEDKANVDGDGAEDEPLDRVNCFMTDSDDDDAVEHMVVVIKNVNTL